MPRRRPSGIDGKPVVTYTLVIVTTVFVNNAYPGRPYRLSAIDSVHWLGVVVIMGAVIGLLPYLLGLAIGADDYIRLSYATSMANIKKGLDRMDRFVRGLGK